jgi:preprotein translocase subunit YajC
VRHLSEDAFIPFNQIRNDAKIRKLATNGMVLVTTRPQDKTTKRTLARASKTSSTSSGSRSKLSCAVALATAVLCAASPPAATQDAIPQNPWQTGIDPAVPKPGTTTIERAPSTDTQSTLRRTLPDGVGSLKLVALLTTDGQRIDQGLIWRIFKFDKKSGQSELLKTVRDGSPTVPLKKGRYLINVSFGRANMTREIKIASDAEEVAEQFVLNAGALRVKTQKSNAIIRDANAITYSVFSDRTQLDERELILANVRPGLVVRLNAGIYHIVSKYGDANAKVASDVTVEAGKLTEVAITHAAAKVRFKLVAREGGEALPDTQWRVETVQGQVVKTSVGALPIHILAPGTYKVVGSWNDEVYQREFTVSDGQMVDVEVVKR